MATIINYIQQINENSTIQDKIDIATKQMAHFARIIKTSKFKRASVEEKKMLAAAWDEVTILRANAIDEKYALLNSFSRN